MDIKNLLNNEITQQDLLNNYNANITKIYLPKYINGFVFNHRGINNIFVSKNLSKPKIKETILHELAHVELNQLEQNNNDLFAFYITEFEDEANKYLKFIKDNLDRW